MKRILCRASEAFPLWNIDYQQYWLEMARGFWDCFHNMKWMCWTLSKNKASGKILEEKIELRKLFTTVQSKLILLCGGLQNYYMSSKTLCAAAWLYYKVRNLHDPLPQSGSLFLLRDIHFHVIVEMSNVLVVFEWWCLKKINKSRKAMFFIGNSVGVWSIYQTMQKGLTTASPLQSSWLSWTVSTQFNEVESTCEDKTSTTQLLRIKPSTFVKMQEDKPHYYYDSTYK